MKVHVLALAALCCLIFASIADARLRPLGLNPSNTRQFQQTLRPKKLALVIGIQHFQKGSGWNPLQYPQKDAKRVAKMLKDAGFDRVLLRTEANETTTTALLRALQRLGEMAKSKADTVLVYISSHGTVALPTGLKRPQRFIITSNTTTRIHQTALSVSRIMTLLKQYLSRRILLMLAVCYNGREHSKSQLQKGMKGLSNQTLPPIQSSAAIQILSAASQGQAAFEHQTLKGDVYTHFYLKCFYKSYKKRPITAIDAHICAVKPTKQFVKQHLGALQVPTLASEKHANRDIFLHKKRKKRAGYLRTTWRKGKALLFRIFRRGSKGNVPLLRINADANEDISLPTGQYRVAVVNQQGTILHTQNVVIQPGETAKLDDPFVLGIQVGTLIAGKMAGQPAFGGAITIQKSFFHAQIGFWNNQFKLDGLQPKRLLFWEARIEAGLPLSFGSAISLFLGAYIGVGLLAQDETTGLVSGWTGSYGLTPQLTWWFQQDWGIRLRINAGFSILTLGNDLEHLPEFNVDLGIQRRF